MNEPLSDVDLPRELSPIHVALTRSAAAALRRGSVMAGTIYRPLTTTILASLSADERAIFDDVASDGESLAGYFNKPLLRLSRLGRSGKIGLDIDTDEVTDDVILSALRARLGEEIAYREELAKSVREDMARHANGRGTELWGTAAELARRPGPRHPTLGDVFAAREAREALEQDEARKVVEARKVARRAEYIALTDTQLISVSGTTPPRHAPVMPDPCVERDEAVTVQVQRAERLAREANELVERTVAPDREALLEFARTVPEFALPLQAGEDVTAGVARYIGKSIEVAVRRLRQHVVSTSVHSGMGERPVIGMLAPSQALQNARASIVQTVNDLPMPRSVRCEVSPLYGPPPYVVVTVSSTLFPSMRISVSLER